MAIGRRSPIAVVAAVVALVSTPVRGSMHNDAVPEAIMRSLAAAGAPAAAVQALAEEGENWFVVPVGDLDGDRRRDVVRIADTPLDGGEAAHVPGMLIVEAARGIDGRALWRHEITGAIGWAMPARLGPDAREGVLVVTYTGYRYLAGAFAMTLTAFIGDDPTPLWDRVVSAGSYAIAAVLPVPLAVGAAEIPIFAGLGQAGGGLAQDVLVGAYTGGSALLTRSAWVMRTEIVSGVDGESLSAATATPDAHPTPMWVGDISGDRLDDFVVLRQRVVVNRSTEVQPIRTEAHRGTDGALLWSSGSGPDDFFTRPPFNIGDTTGDGINDVAVSHYIEVQRSEQGSVSVGGFTLLDGRTGRDLWTALGVARPLGDTNKDGRSEILAAHHPAWPPEPVVRLAIIDGRRRTLRRATHTWPVHRYGAYADAIGDADGDGYIDAAIGVYPMGRSWPLLEGRIISGRTMRRLRGGAYGPSLHASVDGGRGHDMFLIQQDVQILDGATGRMLWSHPNPQSEMPDVIQAADITGDGRAEVFITMSGGTSVLRAADGRVLWR